MSQNEITDWQETVEQLDINASQKSVAQLLELQTHQPPHFILTADREDLRLISPKFLTDLTMALRKHVGGLVHVLVGHEGETQRVVH